MLASKLENFGLIEPDESHEQKRGYRSYRLTESGKQFLLRLNLVRDTEQAEKFLLPYH